FLSEAPVGKVTRQAIGGGQEALICQVHGFYPKDIEATWRKGEENLDHETFRRDIAPNYDGTYYTWLSTEIDSKERDLYRCHVDHASLRKPLVLAFEETGVNVGLIVGAIVGVMVAVLLAVGLTFFIKKCRKKRDYEKASINHLVVCILYSICSNSGPLLCAGDLLRTPLHKASSVYARISLRIMGLVHAAA
ncbi:major histocompatibility complex class I-related gene protein-like, partial [Sceloporus undulatus]|uniref:major histocompatibility complex class I-related gene protein-like n=1 Tax=Sceloporus undulatus TaxID=8520 RepID=UPI001C4CF1D9